MDVRVAITLAVTSVSTWERFFRAAAGLNIDKNDIKRHQDFIDARLPSLVARAEAVAKANGRDLIELWDLPITAGLQACLHEFDKLDADLDLTSALREITPLPPTDFDYSEQTRNNLVSVAGGVSVALARVLRLLDPDVKNPQTTHWERAERLFAVLL
jgi:hypothetical protein